MIQDSQILAVEGQGSLEKWGQLTVSGSMRMAKVEWEGSRIDEDCWCQGIGFAQG
jgi:hypothetical protein